MLLLLTIGLLLQSSCATVPPVPASASGDALLSSLQVTPQGDSVLLVMQVTNTLTSPISMQFNSGQTGEFVVLRGGSEIWRWSQDRMFTQALRTETLPAGETLRLEAIWPVPVGTTGPLEATGRLLAEGVELEQRTTFSLP